MHRTGEEVFIDIFKINNLKINKNDRSTHPKVFLGEGVLEIYSKFIGEQPCQSVISIKSQKEKSHFGMGVLL